MTGSIVLILWVVLIMSCTSAITAHKTALVNSRMMQHLFMGHCGGGEVLTWASHSDMLLLSPRSMSLSYSITSPDVPSTLKS